MPLLSTPIERRAAPAARRGRGFTLLEVLVVVLIIGIVVAVAAIGIRHDSGERLQTEARRFAALLTLANQEAVLQAREFAVAFDDHSYRFLTLGEEDNKWSAPEDSVFRTRTLPDDLYLEVTVEGQAPVFAAGDQGGPSAPQEAGQDKETGPRIFLMSSGEMTPFELVVRAAGSPDSYRVRGDIGGQLELGG